MSSAMPDPDRFGVPASPDAKFGWPFAGEYDVELLWAPYRTACRFLLEAHHQTTAMMDINRKLTEEYLAIAHREQALMHEAVEKVLHRLADGSGPPTGVGTVTTESLAEFYESAVSGLRELADAMVEAQSRSMEALQKHARAAAEISRPERKSA
jgi:hypothetical protein